MLALCVFIYFHFILCVTSNFQIQPATSLGAVQLTEARAPPREVRADESLSLLLPRAPLYPLARFHLPVIVRHEPDRPVTFFILR